VVGAGAERKGGRAVGGGGARSLSEV